MRFAYPPYLVPVSVVLETFLIVVVVVIAVVIDVVAILGTSRGRLATGPFARRGAD
jgi:hypothetical protein